MDGFAYDWTAPATAGLPVTVSYTLSADRLGLVALLLITAMVLAAIIAADGLLKPAKR